MNIARSIREILSKPKLSTGKIGLFAVVLMTVLSGCSSVIKNSEDFYKDMPRRRINWREYLTD